MNIKSYLLLFVLFFTVPLWAREFPLCLYGVGNPADLKQVKKAGFTCIQSYQTEPDKLEPLALEAKKRGLKVLFFPNKLLGTNYQQQAQNWPVLAWYLVDEPDVHKWSRQRVRAAHQAAKQAFPNHPTALVIGQGKTKIPYYDLPDIMMMDWYPVPHLELTSFGDNVRWTKEGQERLGAAGRPLWGVVQIFDWKEFKQYRPDNERIGRFPTTDEIRFMSYHGILEGATGLFYFTFNHQGRPLPQSAPAYWDRVKTVLRELHTFQPILERGESVANPVSVPAPLIMQTWRYKGHLYSVLVNTSGAEQPLPAGLAEKAFKPLFGRKKLAQLPPYYVLVLKHKAF